MASFLSRNDFTRCAQQTIKKNFIRHVAIHQAHSFILPNTFLLCTDLQQPRVHATLSTSKDILTSGCPQGTFLLQQRNNCRFRESTCKYAYTLASSTRALNSVSQWGGGGSSTMTRTWLHWADSTYSRARPKKADPISAARPRKGKLYHTADVMSMSVLYINLHSILLYPFNLVNDFNNNNNDGHHFWAPESVLLGFFVHRETLSMWKVPRANDTSTATTLPSHEGQETQFALLTAETASINLIQQEHCPRYLRTHTGSTRTRTGGSRFIRTTKTEQNSE